MPNGNGNGNGQHKDADGLTVKQALFCREYIRDRNASAACVRAGYSSKGRSVTGTRLLANPSVSAVVSRLAEAHLAKVEMDIDEMCLTASRRCTVPEGRGLKLCTDGVSKRFAS